MLTEVRNNLRYFLSAIKIGIKSAMAYKASFLVQAIFMFINNGFFLVFWKVVFQNVSPNSGITFDNVMYLWAFSTIGYGIAFFFFGGIQRINDYIITGAMDSFLLQPKNVLLNVATSKCNFSAAGDLLYGIILGLILTHGNPFKMLELLILGCFGAIFFVSTEVIFRAIAVWIGDTKTLANRYIEMLLITFSTYPENIFGIGIKAILYTVVPVAYLAYLPAKLMEAFNPLYLVAVIAVGLIYLAISVVVFNKAMRSYESGNSMAMKD